MAIGCFGMCMQVARPAPVLFFPGSRVILVGYGQADNAIDRCFAFTRDLIFYLGTRHIC